MNSLTIAAKLSTQPTLCERILRSSLSGASDWPLAVRVREGTEMETAQAYWFAFAVIAAWTVLCIGGALYIERQTPRR